MQDFERARRQMVDTQIRTSAITDHALLAAMGDVPRERFVPKERRAVAYAEVTHTLGGGKRKLPTPGIFAKLVQLADVDENDVVLDLGCGTGYSVAVLAKLASAVVGVETDEALVEEANTILADLDIGNAAVLAGDMHEGLPKEAPFDVILFEGGVDYVPDELFKQLREGGRLVAMIAEREGMMMSTAHIYYKTSQGVSQRSTFDAAIPHLGTFRNKPEFSL